MIISNFILSTIQIQFNSSFGSAFTAENDNNTKQFLVTARHIFEASQNNEVVSVGIRYVSLWKSIQCKVHFPEDDTVDIAVLELVNIPYITEAHSKELTAAGVLLGQDMYFLGFPFGLCMEDVQGLGYSFPMPLVKKCCMSLFFPREKPHSGLLILDGINNPGFSGGPVCFVDQATKKPKIAAVISGYKANESKVFRTMATDMDAYVRENTGLILAYDIHWAKELIDRL